MSKLSTWFAAASLAAATLALGCGSTNGSPDTFGSNGGGDGGGAGGPDGGGHPADAAGTDEASNLFSDSGLGDGSNCSSASADEKGCECTVGQKHACYTGPSSTRGVGACRDGSQNCVQLGEFGVYADCAGSVLPGPETCSSTIDSNCNGKIGCDDPVACPAGCHMDGGNVPEVGPEAGQDAADSGQVGVLDATVPVCTPPIFSAGNSRCPNGTIQDPTSGNCCPCTATDCGSSNSCCGAAVCASDPSCATCSSSTLPAVCNGMVNLDCDGDFPEDCDQLCCPCKPAVCMTCPGIQVPCDNGSGPVCTDVTSDDTMCGACDNACDPSTHCVNGWCQ